MQLSRKGFSQSTLDIHPYFGKFDPAIPEAIIRDFTVEGMLVLDPFCGSGTALHEAVINGRGAIGFDASPLACLIAAAKICGIGSSDIDSLAALRQRIQSQMSGQDQLRFQLGHLPSEWEALSVQPATSPAMPRVHDVDSWFMPNAMQELRWIKGLLQVAPLQPRARILALTAFSRIITQASNQSGESRYCRVQKPDTVGRVMSLYLKALEDIVRKTQLFTGVLTHRGTTPILESSAWPTGDITIVYHNDDGSHYRVYIRCADSRLAANDDLPLADLLVSSPPYLYSWDYGLYHKFRLYWLDLDLDEYEEREIGRHLRRKNDDISRYIADMAAFFKSMEGRLKPNSLACLVNSNAIIKGEAVDSNRLLADCAQRSRFQLERRSEPLDILGPHIGRMINILGSDHPTESGIEVKKETLLLFRRV